MNNLNLSQLSNRRLGQYELRDLIGTGGMSAVYRAYEPALDREVAIKILATDLATDTDYQQRFAMEARTAAGLEHTHIVPVYHYGTEEGLIYVVMRLLTGGTLAQRLNIASQGARDLPALGDIALLLDTMASALDYAHERRVIHRDIKPSNVMFDAHGAPFLVDFGIARLLNTNLELTAAGTTIGTPNYMAPEQWRDEPLTVAVDQYALGVLIFNTLTGSLPFAATTSHALMYKHLYEAPPALDDLRDGLPEALTPVLQRALAKTPAARFPSISGFAEAFRTAAGSASHKQTDFFKFEIVPSTLPEDPTPVSSARNAAPGSFAQHVPLTAPAGATMPASLPEDFSAGATMPASVPPLPDAPAFGATVPDATMPGPTYESPATQPKGAAVQAPVQQTAMPPAPPPSPSARRRSRGMTRIVIAFAIIAILAVVGFVIGIRALNSRPADPARELPPAFSETAAGPTALPQPTAIALAPDTTRITPANASSLSMAGRPFNQSDTPVRMIAMSSQGMLASAHGDGLVRLWRDGPQGVATELTGHVGVVYTLAFSPDGRLLATGGEDSGIRLWETQGGTRRGILRGHEGLVRGLDFSPDGQQLASAGEDGTVRLWDINANRQRLRLTPAEGRVMDVAFSPNGQMVASADNTNLVRLWDAVSGQALRTFRGHTESVRSVTFSPDGNLLATTSTDNTARIWDVASATLRHTLTGHGRDVWIAAFSPDGTLLATGGRDNTLRVWHVTDGAELATLSNHTGWVLGVDFSADGSLLVSGSGDGSVRLWQPAP